MGTAKTTLWRVSQNYFFVDGKRLYEPHRSLSRVAIFDSQQEAQVAAVLMSSHYIFNFATQIGQKPAYTFYPSKRVQPCPGCTVERTYADIAHLRSSVIHCDNCQCVFEIDDAYPLHPTHDLKIITPPAPLQQTA